MRLTAFICLFAYLVSVSAQGYGTKDLPSCATNCSSTAAKGVGCTLDDTHCLCSHADFSSNTMHCLQSVCSIHDYNNADNILYQMCAASSSSVSSSSTSSSSASPASQSSTGTTPTISANSPTATPTDMTTTDSPDPSQTRIVSSKTSSTDTVVQTVVVVPQTPNSSASGTTRELVLTAIVPVAALLSTMAVMYL